MIESEAEWTNRIMAGYKAENLRGKKKDPKEPLDEVVNVQLVQEQARVLHYMISSPRLFNCFKKLTHELAYSRRHPELTEGCVLEAAIPTEIKNYFLEEEDSERK